MQEISTKFSLNQVTLCFVPGKAKVFFKTITTIGIKYLFLKYSESYVLVTGKHNYHRL